MLEIGVKAGLTGAVAKTLADKLTADELDHLVTLQMTGNDEITSKYLGLLQDKYAPEASSNPNLGKGLDNDQKAELGGVGSGTPGGWGPEDEENGRNSAASTVGKDIADGHAFEKHVVTQNEFADLGIKTKEQFAQHIEKIINNPSASRTLSGGRSAYWDDATGTVVIRNPKASDGGTAFRPVNGRAYFDNLR
ncbi:secreted protein [Trabulsiella guamensis ATCC 49490]|uniref:Secreted protein n=1 Tax=Trabulsiella guamensis ATCC 49490 TaxID=1005994 RepID=A0A084ZP85_9ENTR|nr:secreted protein [Trabulsiella guamensis ATCC 49490]